MRTSLSESQRRQQRTAWQLPTIRWLVPIATVMVFAGYVAPWVDHRVAGLVITGLDLGEYVKFLLPVRSGDIALWREGFYAPLVTISLACSFYAFQRALGYGWVPRVLLLLLAVIAALNLLPPAWSPARLLTPEFRIQSLALLVCGAAAGFSPFLGLIPLRAGGSAIILLTLLSLWWPITGFLRVLPTISELYQRALTPGWGMYLLCLGLVALGTAALIGAWEEHRGGEQGGQR